MLRLRLTLGLLPLLLLMLAAVGYALKTSRDLATTMSTVTARNLESIRAVQELRDTALKMNDMLADARHDNGEAAKWRFEGSRARFKRQINEALMASSGEAARSTALESVDAQFARFVQAGERTLRLGPLETFDGLKESGSALSGLMDSLDRYLSVESEAVRTLEARVRVRGAEMLKVLTLALIGAVILFFLIAGWLAGSLLRPIRALKVSAMELGDGNLDREVPVVSRDELGDLARTFNSMAEKLRAYRDAMAAKVVQAQRTMEATLRAAPDAVFIMSADGSVALRNPAADALVAKCPAFADGLPEVLQKPVREVLSTGVHHLPSGYDHALVLNVDREDHYVLPRVLAIGDPLTGFGGAAVILQDVTKFRLLDDAKTNLVGTVSHELKTPLTSLRMAVYLLLEQNLGTLSAAQRDLLETARDDSERLLRILNDLLDLTRLEAGATELVRGIEPIDPLLKACVDEVRTLATQKQMQLGLDIADKLPVVSIDRDRLRHVFINFLSNAIKYTPEGSRITLYAEDAEGGWIRCGVRDNGPGLESEQAARVFEKFYRVPGQLEKGVGLGLAISREIVVAHGGTIGVNAAPGKGCDFWVLLPSAVGEVA